MSRLSANETASASELSYALMTYDELIAAGIWGGQILALRQRMSDYIVDGVRLGAIELETKSGSANDVFLEKRIGEILTASLVLAQLGNENVQLTSTDATGKELERPDLDARLADGTEIGLEVADVVATRDAKHDAVMSGIEKDIRDLLETDPTFAKGFGNYYLTVTVNGVGPYPRAQVGSKKEATAMREEIVTFVRAGNHQVPTENYFSNFPPQYLTLFARGAQYNAEAWEHEPYFTMSEGASTIDTAYRPTDVLRVLERHRNSALTYRPVATWLILLLTDHLEYFRNTISEIARLNPPIHPFLKAHIADTAGRIIELPR